MKVADADFSTVKGLSDFFLVHCLMFQRESALKKSHKLLVCRQVLLVKMISILYFAFYYLSYIMAKITAETWLQTPCLHLGNFSILTFPSAYIFLPHPFPLVILGFNQILNVTSMQFVFNRFRLQLNTSQLSELSDLEKCCSTAFDTEGLVKAPGLNSSEMVLLSVGNGSLLSISRKIPPQFE